MINTSSSPYHNRYVQSPDGQGQTFSAGNRDMNSPTDATVDHADLLQSTEKSKLNPKPPAAINQKKKTKEQPKQEDWWDTKFDHVPSRREIAPRVAEILKRFPAQPYKDMTQRDKRGYLLTAPPNGHHFPQIIEFGKHFGFAPASSDPFSGQIMGGHHKGGHDNHFRGYTVDFDVKGHTDDEINYFVQQAVAAGYSVEDARDDDGAHLHVSGLGMKHGTRYYVNDKGHGGKTNPRRGIIQPPGFGGPMRPLPDPRLRRR